MFDNLPSPSEPVTLLDGATGIEFIANIRPVQSAADLEWIERAWQVSRLAATQAIEAAGGHVEHGHWDWSRKGPWVESGHLLGYFLEHAGEPQGVLLFKSEAGIARCSPDTGKPILYVEFVEAAPWNTKLLSPLVRYKPVGIVLLRQAVLMSQRRGWAGRIGLHALPQAEAFYARSQMTSFGRDESYDGLIYFEFGTTSADEFLLRQMRRT